MQFSRLQPPDAKAKDTKELDLAGVIKELQQRFHYPKFVLKDNIIVTNLPLQALEAVDVIPKKMVCGKKTYDVYSVKCVDLLSIPYDARVDILPAYDFNLHPLPTDKFQNAVTSKPGEKPGFFKTQEELKKVIERFQTIKRLPEKKRQTVFFEKLSGYEKNIVDNKNDEQAYDDFAKMLLEDGLCPSENILNRIMQILLQKCYRQALEIFNIAFEKKLCDFVMLSLVVSAAETERDHSLMKTISEKEKILHQRFSF